VCREEMARDRGCSFIFLRGRRAASFVGWERGAW